MATFAIYYACDTELSDIFFTREEYKVEIIASTQFRNYPLPETGIKKFREF